MRVSGCEHDIVWVDVPMQNNAACHAGVQVHQCSGDVHTPAQAVCVCVDAPDWMCHLLQNQLPDCAYKEDVVQQALELLTCAVIHGLGMQCIVEDKQCTSVHVQHASR